MLLKGFSAPGNLPELSNKVLVAWSGRVSKLFDDVVLPSRHFYNPTKTDTPADHGVAAVRWPAAPGRLLSQRLSQKQRWDIADGDRAQQDEYCEWSVLRDGDKIVRVTFTTETPEYYDHLMDTDQNLLVNLYQKATGKTVPIEKLRNKHGFFVAANQFNSSTDGTIVHLMQLSNNLRAAVVLAAMATVLRKNKTGHPVTHPQTLVQCGGLGDETRHSDPQIASAINNLVSKRFEVTLADPPGLYLDRLITTGMETPDGTDAQSFWSIERGDAGHAVRAHFEVPANLGYTVSEFSIGGTPIHRGAQLADRVQVRIEAMAKRGDFQLAHKPCIKSSGI